jgi:hypothetical protein
MRHPFVLAVLLACAALPVREITTDVPAAGLPSASQYAATLLPETPGVVPWRTLGQVETERVGIRMVNKFSSEILALDQKEVKLQGFMVPLDVGDRQKRFLITAVPADCSFCLPAGPDALVEVLAKTPVRYGTEPIVVSGRFWVLKDDAGGLLYRLTDAEAVGPAAPAAPAPAAARKKK